MPRYVLVIAALLLAVQPAAPSIGPFLEPHGARVAPAAPSIGPFLEPNG